MEASEAFEQPMSRSLLALIRNLKLAEMNLTVKQFKVDRNALSGH